MGVGTGTPRLGPPEPPRRSTFQKSNVRIFDYNKRLI